MHAFVDLKDVVLDCRTLTPKELHCKLCDVAIKYAESRSLTGHLRMRPAAIRVGRALWLDPTALELLDVNDYRSPSIGRQAVQLRGRAQAANTGHARTY